MIVFREVTMNSDNNVTAHFILSKSSNPNIADNDNITTYPNPAIGENINIQISALEGLVNIEITDFHDAACQ